MDGSIFVEMEDEVSEMEAQVGQMEAFITREEEGLEDLEALTEAIQDAGKGARAQLATAPPPAQTAVSGGGMHVYEEPGLEGRPLRAKRGGRQRRGVLAQANTNTGDERSAKRRGSMSAKKRRRSSLGNSLGNSMRSSFRTSMGGGVGERAKGIWIEPLEEEEVAEVPHYLLGRLTRGKINAAAEELSAFVQAKYELMGMPTRKMNNAQLHRYKAYRANEIPGKTDNEFFFVEADIRDFTHIRVDRTGRALLQILRTTGRLSEIRDSNCVRYCVVTL